MFNVKLIKIGYVNGHFLKTMYLGPKDPKIIYILNKNSTLICVRSLYYLCTEVNVRNWKKYWNLSSFELLQKQRDQDFTTYPWWNIGSNKRKVLVYVLWEGFMYNQTNCNYFNRPTLNYIRLLIFTTMYGNWRL